MNGMTKRQYFAACLIPFVPAVALIWALAQGVAGGLVRDSVAMWALIGPTFVLGLFAALGLPISIWLLIPSDPVAAAGPPIATQPPQQKKKAAHDTDDDVDDESFDDDEDFDDLEVDASDEDFDDFDDDEDFQSDEGFEDNFSDDFDDDEDFV